MRHQHLQREHPQLLSMLKMACRERDFWQSNTGNKSVYLKKSLNIKKQVRNYFNTINIWLVFVYEHKEKTKQDHNVSRISVSMTLKIVYP